MSGEHDDGWSRIAADWSVLWGGFAEPARRAVVETTRIGPGSRVLDVGCGSGEFLALVTELGAIGVGIDPAPGMVERARTLVPGVDVRVGSVERVPWPDASFDVVTAVNSLQFAEDTVDALREIVRVVIPGGLVAVANWAEAARNDLSVIEEAVALAAGERMLPDGDLRQQGGLEELFAEAGLDLVAGRLVELPWEPAADDTLVRGVLLGEDEAGLEAGAATVIEAAQRFRVAAGGYRLVNAFRLAVGRTPAGGTLAD
ncbi:class I SAM-dependent methyltransferase [Glaciibacter sp. 2TAF33]|uniref:class I SAM-dependent methyltransferase n=1 Tax=Glaciibacter sp. 2TAF33 TaxID=3233015 RepID=UPI003F92136A